MDAPLSGWVLPSKINAGTPILFGSIARGEETRRSDVDLILIQETQKRFWDRYDDLLLALGQAAGQRAVEALIYTSQEFESMQDRAFIRRAIREGVVLFEREDHETQSGMKNAASL